ITSTGLTLAAVSNQKSDDNQNSPILLLNRGGTEMIWRQGATPKMLRHIPVTQNGHGLPAIAPLGAEVHRAVNLAYANGKPLSDELLIIDGVGVSQDQLAQLEARAGVKVRVHQHSADLGSLPPA